MKTIIKKFASLTNKVMGFGEKSPAGKYPGDTLAYQVSGVNKWINTVTSKAEQVEQVESATHADYQIHQAQGYTCAVIAMLFAYFPNVEIVAGWHPMPLWCFVVSVLFVAQSYLSFKNANTVNALLKEQGV